MYVGRVDNKGNEKEHTGNTPQGKRKKGTRMRFNGNPTQFDNQNQKDKNMTGKGTYFIDRPAPTKNTEFKLLMGIKNEPEPIACKILGELNGKTMIEYSSGTETFVKWVEKEQIITVE